MDIASRDTHEKGGKKRKKEKKGAREEERRGHVLPATTQASRHAPWIVGVLGITSRETPEEGKEREGGREEERKVK